MKKKKASKDVSQQYARFLEAAKKSRADQSGGKYSGAFKKVATARKVPKGSGL